MISRVLLAAFLAGIAAGVVMAAMHQWRVAPLILEAERYEKAEPAATPEANTQGQTTHSHAAGTPAHGHDEETWAPADGGERIAYTVAADIVAGVGFALLIAGIALTLALPLTAANGLLWGLAGFAAFTLAPSAGLPPELPGMPAADLASRQLWWWATVAATGLGIGLMAFTTPLAGKIAGVVLIALPHVVGAPQPGDHHSDVPAALANAFAATSIAASAVFWVVLGLALGFALDRLARSQPAPEAAA